MVLEKKVLVPWLVVAILIAALAITIMLAVNEHNKATALSVYNTATSAAEKAKEEAYHELESTPSGDLIDASPDASALTGARDRLIDEFSAESADRIRQILLRRDGKGAP